MNATDKKKLAQAKALQMDIENGLTEFAWKSGLGCPCGTQFDPKEFDVQKYVQRAYDRYFGHKSPLFPRVKDGTAGGSKEREPISRSWERTGRGNKFDLLLSLSSKGLAAGKHLLVDVKAKDPSAPKPFKCTLLGTSSISSQRDLRDVVAKKGYSIIFAWQYTGGGDCDGVLTEEDCNDEDPNSTALSEDDCDDGDENSTVLSEDEDCDGVLTEEDCDDGNIAGENCTPLLCIQGFQPLVYIQKNTGALAFQRSSLNVWVDPTQVNEQNGFTAVYKLTKENLVRVTKEVYLMSK